MDGDDKVADSVAVRAEVPVVSERHMEEVPVEVLEAVVVSAADRAAVPAGVLGVPVVSEAYRGMIPEEDPAVSEACSAMATEVVPVVLETHRGAIPVQTPVLAAYRTDNTENRAADRAVVPASAEVLEALAEEPACAYGHRKYPA